MKTILFGTTLKGEKFFGRPRPLSPGSGPERKGKSELEENKFHKLSYITQLQN